MSPFEADNAGITDVKLVGGYGRRGIDLVTYFITEDQAGVPTIQAIKETRKIRGCLRLLWRRHPAYISLYHL